MNIIVKIFFPLIGIGIILFCLLSFIFPFGRKFKNKVQKIKGFGVDIEVSVLTLFILIGFILSFIGLFLNIKSYEDSIKDMNKKILSIKTENKMLSETIKGKEKMEINVLLNLEIKDNDEPPEIDQLKCEYYLNVQGKKVSIECKVGDGVANDQFQITLKDITRDITIWKIVLTEKSTNKKWVYNRAFSPCVPEIKLSIEE